MLNGNRSIYQLINLIDLIISFEMCFVKLFLDPVLTCAILHSYLQIESDIDTFYSNQRFNQPIVPNLWLRQVAGSVFYQSFSRDKFIGLL